MAAPSLNFVEAFKSEPTSFLLIGLAGLLAVAIGVTAVIGALKWARLGLWAGSAAIALGLMTIGFGGAGRMTVQRRAEHALNALGDTPDVREAIRAHAASVAEYQVASGISVGGLAILCGLGALVIWRVRRRA